MPLRRLRRVVPPYRQAQRAAELVTMRFGVAREDLLRFGVGMAILLGPWKTASPLASRKLGDRQICGNSSAAVLPA